MEERSHIKIHILFDSFTIAYTSLSRRKTHQIIAYFRMQMFHLAHETNKTRLRWYMYIKHKDHELRCEQRHSTYQWLHHCTSMLKAIERVVKRFSIYNQYSKIRIIIYRCRPMPYISCFSTSNSPQSTVAHNRHHFASINVYPSVKLMNSRFIRKPLSICSPLSIAFLA